MLPDLAFTHLVVHTMPHPKKQPSGKNAGVCAPRKAGKTRRLTQEEREKLLPTLARAIAHCLNKDVGARKALDLKSEDVSA